MRESKRGLLLAGLAGFVLQTGCMSYTQIEPVDLSGHEEIRITMVSGQQENLWEPRLVGDTLSGLRASGDTLRIPLSSVQEIRVGDTDTGKTIALVFAVAGFVGLVALVGLIVGLAQADCIGLCVE